MRKITCVTTVNAEHLDKGIQLKDSFLTPLETEAAVRKQLTMAYVTQLSETDLLTVTIEDNNNATIPQYDIKMIGFSCNEESYGRIRMLLKKLSKTELTENQLELINEIKSLFLDEK